MRTILSLLILPLVIVACILGVPSAVYPSDGVAYPSDQIPIRPQVAPTSGAIVGKLINSNTGLLASGVIIHLAKTLPLSPGPGHLFTFDMASAPRAQTKADGSFMFENIEPGEYGLLVWTPHETSQVEYSDNPDEELIVAVEAGRVIDVGTVKVAVP